MPSTTPSSTVGSMAHCSVMINSLGRMMLGSAASQEQAREGLDVLKLISGFADKDM